MKKSFIKRFFKKIFYYFKRVCLYIFKRLSWRFVLRFLPLLTVFVLFFDLTETFAAGSYSMIDWEFNSTSFTIYAANQFDADNGYTYALSNVQKSSYDVKYSDNAGDYLKIYILPSSLSGVSSNFFNVYQSGYYITNKAYSANGSFSSFDDVYLIRGTYACTIYYPNTNYLGCGVFSSYATTSSSHGSGTLTASGALYLSINESLSTLDLLSEISDNITDLESSMIDGFASVYSYLYSIDNSITDYISLYEYYSDLTVAYQQDMIEAINQLVLSYDDISILLQDISSNVASINTTTSAINSTLNTVNSRLNTANSYLKSICSYIESIDDTLTDLYEYITGDVEGSDEMESAADNLTDKSDELSAAEDEYNASGSEGIDSAISDLSDIDTTSVGTSLYQVFSNPYILIIMVSALGFMIISYVLYGGH